MDNASCNQPPPCLCCLKGLTTRSLASSSSSFLRWGAMQMLFACVRPPVFQPLEQLCCSSIWCLLHAGTRHGIDCYCNQPGTELPPCRSAPWLMHLQEVCSPCCQLQVADDIKSILRIPRCETFRHSINRPNIFYEVGTEHMTQLVLQPGSAFILCGMAGIPPCRCSSEKPRASHRRHRTFLHGLATTLRASQRALCTALPGETSCPRVAECTAIHGMFLVTGAVSGSSSGCT